MPITPGRPLRYFRSRSVSVGRRCCWVVALLWSLAPPQARAADKTDVVVMTNGDRLVGEIKKLEVGQLQFKASYMAASVNLDWTKIIQIQSIRQFRVEFEDGTLESGLISKSPSGNDLILTTAIGTTTQNALDVVSIQPLEGSFFHRLRGSADLGFTLNPESDQTQLTANLSVEYPSENFRTFVSASSLFSSKEESDDIVRNSFSLAHYQFLSRRWFLAGISRFLQDNELNLDLRSTFGGGPGHFFIHSNRTGLAVLGGIVATHEKYFDTSASSNRTNAEALLGMEFYTVRFASSQFSTAVFLYSGLTQRGRQRIDWESSVSWKFWKDVYWKMTVHDDFDSRPPLGASRNDFSLTTNFGLTF